MFKLYRLRELMFKKKNLTITTLLILVLILVVFVGTSTSPLLINDNLNRQMPQKVEITKTSEDIVKNHTKKFELSVIKPDKADGCDKNMLHSDLNLLIKQLAIAVKQYDLKEKQKTSLTAVHELLAGNHTNHAVATQTSHRLISANLLIEIKLGTSLDVKFATHIVNSQFDAALKQLVLQNRENRINYIAEAVSLNNKIPADYLAELKHYSNKVTIRDAIALTQHGYDKAALALLFDDQNFAVNSAWYNGSKIMTLPIVAIENSNLDALKYWLDNGLLINTAGINTYPLQRIHPPENNNEYQSARKIANLIAQSTGEITTTEYLALKRWMSKADLEKLVVNDNGIARFLAQSDHQELSELNTIVNIYKKELSDISDKYPDCFINKSLARNYTNYIKPFFETDENILHKSIFETRAINPLLTANTAIANQLLLLIGAKQWAEALTLAESLFFSENDKNALNFLLELYLANNSPIDFVRQAIESGAAFNKNAVFDLILLNKRASMTEYRQLGLDIAYINADGYNALHFAVVNRSNPGIISDLHQAGVPFIKDNRGYTPMDYLMKNSDNSANEKKVLNYFHSLGTP